MDWWISGVDFSPIRPLERMMPLSFSSLCLLNCRVDFTFQFDVVCANGDQGIAAQAKRISPSRAAGEIEYLSETPQNCTR